MGNQINFEKYPDKVLHLFACDCAEMALKRERSEGREPAAASWEAVKAKRQWLKGEISKDKLKEFWEAAAAAAAEAVAAYAAYTAAAYGTASYGAAEVAAEAADAEVAAAEAEAAYEAADAAEAAAAAADAAYSAADAAHAADAAYSAADAAHAAAQAATESQERLWQQKHINTIYWKYIWETD